MAEPFDVDVAERLLRDAEAVVGEFMPSLDETAGRFSSESFEATVTGDGARLVRLAEDAQISAEVGRHVAALYETFALGVETHSMELVRVAASEMRRVAEQEHRMANLSDSRDGGVQGDR